jgi:hypothetical protein
MRAIGAFKLGAKVLGGLFAGFAGLVLVGQAMGPARPARTPIYSYVVPKATYLNNYRAGSYSHDLVAPAAEFFPHLSIVWVDGRAKADLIRSNPGQDIAQAYPIMESYGKQKLSDVGYVVNAITVNEDTFTKNNTCPVFTTKNLDSKSFLLQQGVVLHESIHCARFQVMEYNHDQLVAQLKSLFARVEQGLNGQQMDEFMRAMDEGMVTAMLRSLSFEPGDIGKVATAQFNREYQMAVDGVYVNETPALAKKMPEICAKQGDCPTEISALMTKLFADKRYVQAMVSDIKWLNSNADKWKANGAGV